VVTFIDHDHVEGIRRELLPPTLHGLKRSEQELDGLGVGLLFTREHAHRPTTVEHGAVREHGLAEDLVVVTEKQHALLGA